MFQFSDALVDLNFCFDVEHKYQFFSVVMGYSVSSVFLVVCTGDKEARSASLWEHLCS